MEKNTKMKVLVGCPVSDYKRYCTEEYIKAVKELDYRNYDILLVDNSEKEDFFNEIKERINVVRVEWHEEARKRIVESRNKIREKAIEEGYDYLLSLEQDIIPPKDIIGRLLRHRKKIISGVYFSYQTNNNVTMLVPLLWQDAGNDEIRYMLEKEVTMPKLMKVKACGLGCVMIAREVLEKIRFRYERYKESFDDMWFCKDAYDKGFEIYTDTSVKCKHLIKGWKWDGIKK